MGKVEGLTAEEATKRKSAALADLEAYKQMYESRRDVINDALKFEEGKRGELLKGYEAHYSKADEMAKKSSLNTREQNKLSLDNLSDIYKAGKLGLAGMIETGEGAFNSFKENQKSAVMTVLSSLGIANDAAMTSLVLPIQKMPGEIDTSFRKIVKDTGLFSEEMQQAFVYALDPLYANRRERLFETSLNQPLMNVGITAAETGGALGGLLKNVSMFRPAFISANKETAAYTANVVAGLNKIGITVESSTSIIEDMTKMFGDTPDEATKQVRRMVTIADTLGISAAKVSSDFAKALPSLAMFGDEAVDQFANLEAQATATGLSMGTLISYAEGLDTFKGAATAAQGLNAVLGGTFVSVTDLVHAPFDEKLKIIREAMDRANISFADAPRRMQQVIAKAAGFKSVGEAMKALGSKDEFEELADGMSTHAASTEEMSEKIRASMNSAEMLQRSLSSLGGGFSKFVDRTREAAVEGSQVMLNTFRQGTEQLKDSEVVAFSVLALAKQAQGPLGSLAASLMATYGLLKGGIEDLTGADKKGAGPQAKARAPGGVERITENTRGKEVNTLIASVNKFADSVQKAGKKTIQVNVGGSKVAAADVDVFKGTFEKVFGDVTTVATG